RVAQKLGLDARQILLPREVVLEPQNLPALLVVQKEDQGLHFVVAWRRSGQQVQVMDPSRGRVWLSVGSLLRKIYVHVQPMPAPAWRRWAAGPTGLELLCGWMEGLGFTETQQEEQVVAALADPGWEGFAALFASLRLLRLLKEEGALKEGPSLLARLLPLARAEAHDPRSVPYDFWPVHPTDTGVVVVGVVGLVVRGRHPTAAGEGLDGELAAVLHHREPSPWPLVVQTLREAEPRLGLRLGILAAGLAGGTLLELLFWRLLLELGTVLGSPPGRVVALGAAALLALALLGLRWAGDSEMLRLGRQLELRLRVALLSHLPRLGDRYFHSRPVSDLAERAHALHLLRNLPASLFQGLRACVDLVVTVTILGLLLPASLPLTLAISLISLGIPWALQRGMQEAAQRQGGLSGAVARVGLDALSGGVALRTHGAASALEVEYEGLLVELVRAGRAMQGAAVRSAVISSAVGSLGIAALLSLGAWQESLSLLYLLFAMRLPMIGQSLGSVFLQLPGTRAHVLRLLEPLSTPVEPTAEGEAPPLPEGALDLELVGVQVEAAGHVLLAGVDLRVAPGEHVA
ncbi:MAG TPA: ABC transporter transmembrane domain-containing protein, partial [Myxococcota bacterium]|nr:ABC transporter transmembrane domain-containing protein [Myxococcota bacterium]